MDNDVDSAGSSSSESSGETTRRRHRSSQSFEEVEGTTTPGKGSKRAVHAEDKRLSSASLPFSGAFDSKALQERSWQSERRDHGALSRVQRVENSWVDVSSDEDEQDEPMMRAIDDGREADGWEDESSSEEDSDNSAESSATASGRPDESVRSRQSNKSALREYRQSKRALMMSESNNMERYNRLMRGGQQPLTPPEDSDMEMREELLLHGNELTMAGATREGAEEADPSGWTDEIRLHAGNTTMPNKRRSQQQLKPGRISRKASSIDSRSPRLGAAAASRSASATAISAGQANESNEEQSNMARGSQNGPVKELYASEPASPLNEADADEEMSKRVSNQSAVTSLSNWGSAISIAVGMTTASSGSEKKAGDMMTLTSPAMSDDATEAKAQRKAPTSKMLSSQLDQIADAAPPFSLWDYLKEEVMATDFDNTQELKWERVTNFIAIPFWMEKIMVFGFAVCLDSFLYTFTILPLRSLVALFMWTRNTLMWLLGGQKRYLHSSHKCDMLKALLIVLSCYILSRVTDASKMYHSVRGQDVVKLSVIFNVLEIADRLCCSFGQDLLDTLFSRMTLARRKDGRQPYLRPIGFFLLSLGYVLAHTLVLFYQLVTLNVAINSYDNALLTLLLSNQFVEIKGSVFKKFEKENLFQLTCADIVERFQLTLMLGAIGLRNLIEVAGASGNSPAVTSQSSMLPPGTRPLGAIQNDSALASIGRGILSPLPTSYTVFPSFSLLETSFTPVCIVLASECLVDWLKHAFITKFNHIRPSVYGRFMDVLCRDLTAASGTGTTASRRKHTFVDQSPVVSRRLGFASIPLACLLVRMTSQIMTMLKDDSHFDECAMPSSHSQHSTSGQFEANSNSLIKVWSAARSAFILVLGGLTNEAEMKFDLIWNYLLSASAWILTILIAWIFLVAVKLLLGTNLVSYASHRYSTMGEREREEDINAKGRSPIGVDKDEKAYEEKLVQLIDKREDDASKYGLDGQPVQASSNKKERKAANVGSLMDVDRYTMIRSRIW
ncbi:hypothetical protein CBS101457_001976 [Exobasidium rhododendri]|nr:hypothetical protein CBS101457_001976 [Exobasidium rhododendri]